jgi:parallel beta-helix repeat protein
MTLSRRDVIKFALSAAVLSGPGAKASADELQLIEVNVRDYGAKGDGTSDDTVAIHAARDAAGVGGRVLIPSGTYAVSGLTANVANQTWELSDGAVVNMKAGATEILSVTGTGVSVFGGVFDGSNGTARDTWRQQGIRVSGDGVTVRNAKVQNSPAIGLYALNCSQITISGCTFTDNWYCGIFVQNARPDTGVYDIYDIVITDNLVKGSSDSANGIYVRGNSGTELVHRVTISGNTVILPYNQGGYETGAIILFYGVDWLIDNNIAHGGDLGITCPVSTKAMISNNVVRGFSWIGIEIPGDRVGGGVNHVTIKGNIVDPDGTSATSGIQSSAGNVNDVRIVGNVIKNFSSSCSLIDFNSGSVSRHITITGNFLTSAVGLGSFTGVYFNGSITGLAMSGNTVDGSSSRSALGVQFLKGALGVSINANRFANLADAVVVMGAYDASDELDYINVAGNVVVNCGALLKNSTSNGAIVGNNIFT